MLMCGQVIFGLGSEKPKNLPWQPHPLRIKSLSHVRKTAPPGEKDSSASVLQNFRQEFPQGSHPRSVNRSISQSIGGSINWWISQ